MHMYIHNHNLVVSLAILTTPLFFSVVQENVSCLGWPASTFLEGWDCSFWDGSSMSQLATMMRAATHHPHRCRSSHRCTLVHIPNQYKELLMGIIVAPDQPAYFCTDNLFKCTGISDRFTRDRLMKLHRYFHVDDTAHNPPRNAPGHDKLAHIRHVMTTINDRCQNAFHPHRETSIDEAMIAYTGHLSFKQYVPMKPTKRGVKVWMRADPHNGFVNEFQVYTGKEGAVEHGLGERVMRDLCQNIVNRNHHVYCDNYFTCVPLFEYLLENNTYACGTV